MLARRGCRPEWAIRVFQNAQCVFFDVDSTLSNQEGLDELARYLGKYDQVSKLTEEYIELRYYQICY